MSTNKHINKICCVVIVICIAITTALLFHDSLGITSVKKTVAYESQLFDTSKLHTIDIVMNEWDDMISDAREKEYYDCNIVIDGKKIKNVAIRTKGNSSLSQVSSTNSERYSLKIEFDHYDDNKSYYGLDKLCLNNIIQDTTFMKDYISYQLMNEFGVASPLTSFTRVNVNGEFKGVYIAVEAIEDAFLQRNYGNENGSLYKPETEEQMGGAKDKLNNKQDINEQINKDKQNIKGNKDFAGNNDDRQQAMGRPDNMLMGGNTEGEALKYIDDNYDSYSYIFNNAVTKITDKHKDTLINSLKNISSGTDLENSLDTDKVIKYFVVHNFLLNFDSYTGSIMHNYYLYENDGKLTMLPWDYNLSFASFRSNADTQALINFPIDTPVSAGTVSSRPMLSWIFDNEEFTHLYHQYFSEFIEKFCDSGKINKILDNAKSLITDSVKEDPTKFYTYEEFEKGFETLKQFIDLRAESITGQLNGTIGKTADEQSDKKNLVEAGNLNITDTGSESMQKNQQQGNFPQVDDNQQQTPPQMGDNHQQFPPQMGENQQQSPPQMGENQQQSPPQMGENQQQAPPQKGESQQQTPPQMGENQQQGNHPQMDGNQQLNNNEQNRHQHKQAVEEKPLSDINLMPLIISISVLAIGLVFAITFRRRKKL